MHLHIRDLGPHAETTIPLTGRVTLRGASESGRSTRIRALAGLPAAPADRSTR